MRSVSNEETEIPKLPNNETNTLLENKSSTNKEFWIYTESTMVRMINPYYVDSSKYYIASIIIQIGVREYLAIPHIINLLH